MSSQTEMSKRISEAPVNASTTQESLLALQKSQDFITNRAAQLASLVGLEGVRVSSGEWWTTNLQTGEITVAPDFFAEKGYSADETVYAMLHELSAHLRTVFREPRLAKRELEFGDKSEAHHVFMNVITDIQGNRRINRSFPRMADTCKGLYKDKLFPTTDFRGMPRHIQFINSLLRESMVPDQPCIVDSDVAEALSRVRNYGEDGLDMVVDITDPSKEESFKIGSATKTYSPEKRCFELSISYLWPIYEELLRQDLSESDSNSSDEQQQNASDQNQPSRGSDSNFQPENSTEQSNDDPAEDSDSSNQRQSTESIQDTRSGQKSRLDPDEILRRFGEYYKDIENRHPEPISHEEIEKIIAQSQAKIETQPREITPAERQQRLLERQWGASVNEIHLYNQEMMRFGQVIQDMMKFFDSLISEEVSHYRSLTQSVTEGSIINSNRLAQTIADFKAGVNSEDIPAFLDYEPRQSERKLEGHFDCYLVMDCSGSMRENGKSQVAAVAVGIFLESLEYFNQKIAEVAEEEQVVIDMEVRSSVHVFGEEYEQPKPLAVSITKHEKIDSFLRVAKSDMDGTNDYLALDNVESIVAIEQNKPEGYRRQPLVIVVSDGESDDADQLRASIDRLRQLGSYVVGIGIIDGAVEVEYAPDGQTISDISDLPRVLSTILKDRLSK